MVTTFTYKPSLVRIDARISSYRGNRHTHKQTHTQTHRQDRLQYTASLSLARSTCNNMNVKQRSHHHHHHHIRLLEVVICNQWQKYVSKENSLTRWVSSHNTWWDNTFAPSLAKFGCSYMSHHVGVYVGGPKNLGRILKLRNHVRPRLNCVGVRSAESNGIRACGPVASCLSRSLRVNENDRDPSVLNHGSIEVCLFRGKWRLVLKTHFPTPCV